MGRVKHPHADRCRAELQQTIHNSTYLYNMLLQGCKTLSSMSHLPNPNYTEAVCILARFMEHSSNSKPVPRPTDALLCKHDKGTCRAPQFKSDTQRMVFETNHIVQAELVSNDPILRPALRVIRDAMARFKTFREVVVEFASLMKDVDGVEYDPCVYAKQHITVTFQCTDEPLDVTFETRAVFASFLACKTMWMQCEGVPAFGSTEVGKRAAIASLAAASKMPPLLSSKPTVIGDGEERSWKAFSRRTKQTPTQRNSARFERFGKVRSKERKDMLDDFFSHRMRGSSVEKEDDPSHE